MSIPVFFVLAATGTIDSTYKYAWSNNIGWLNFGCSNCNVQITDSKITGYAWSENYGWINLNPTQSGVKNTIGGALSGSAWGENVGWIDFSGAHIDCSGKFGGSATGNIVGIISFDCTNCDVRTDNWRPVIGCGGGGPPFIPVEESHNECNVQKQCVSITGVGSNQCSVDNDCNIVHNECTPQNQCVPVIGVGVNQCQTSGDCLLNKHNECNPQNQCVAVDGVGTDQCLTSDDCHIFHNECTPQNQCVPVIGVGVNQCQTSGDCLLNKHNECNSQKKCVVVDGVGGDSCQTNGDCVFVHNECNNSRCVSVSGVGINQCSNDDGCLILKHNQCNAQNQCVLVDGGGSNQCQTNNDCGATPPIEIPDETPDGDAGEVIIGIINAIKDRIPESVNAVAKQIKKIIEVPQVSVVTKAISTTGVAIATIATVSSFPSLPFVDILLSPFKLFGLLMTFFGLRRKPSPWGVVYDSTTKRPLDPAYVVLKNLKGETISNAITDIDGRYGFLVEPGVYQMQARKTNYIFPSQKLSGRTEDELYKDLYFGGNIEIQRAGGVITKNIPLDPVKFDWNEFEKKSKHLMRFYSKLDIVMRRIYDSFFIVGFVVAIIAYIFAPHPYNTIIISVYLLLLLFRVLGLKPKPYGHVLDKATSTPLSFAIIRVMLPGSDIEVSSKSADKYGKYYCLVPPGKYYIRIEKKNKDGSYSLVHTSPTINVSRKGIIEEKFRV